jgi:hypothetical protein
MATVGRTSWLEHTAASLALAAGANVNAVQQMLHRASAGMTLEVYADRFHGGRSTAHFCRNHRSVESRAWPLISPTAVKTRDSRPSWLQEVLRRVLRIVWFGAARASGQRTGTRAIALLTEANRPSDGSQSADRF